MTPIPPCPKSPNCVASAPGTDPSHFIEPLRYSGTLEEARNRIKTILQTMPRTRIIRDEETYLLAECTSFFFRFVDDLEFWFDPETPFIHVRSASRVGYSDLGVNRKRLESIRTQLVP